MSAFEEKLQRLEAIARRLEDPAVPLEEALELYEEGIRLVRDCEAFLREARLRVEVLVKTGEGLTRVPLEESHGGEGT
ncbi:exodeoxyribonuclease VII small subunit [Thermosulfurimonas marina]|uniref:Exodeoxyribonuclease 7 small subunit n=1 Tax=Thermosulfurimonas marina TaxID=2047767 RepID=A0A6H1WQX9_9BACT|nr:exodeoxyribonuclease VII small subunit [Thermosulfurimonas marina]